MIVQQGALNTTALVVPGLYVQIVPPQQLVLNGVPTNVVGIVGSASWGPVDRPTIIGSYAQYFAAFGPVMNRKYDMGTPLSTAVLQGAQNFRCVRVTDGTDAAASVVVETNCITFTAKYTGSFGNGISVTLSTGSKVNTFRAVVGVAGVQPEVFDNVPGTGNAFWINLATAINSGNSVTRPASNFITATAGVGTTAPTTGTAFPLTSGTDGASGVSSTQLIGADTAPRTGMYALRSQGCSVALLSDCDTSTTWTTQAAFGLSEGIYMICVAPAGTAISNGTTGTVDLKSSAGLDSYACKLLHGDWLYWNDPINQILRLVSPQGFAAGLYGNMTPPNSGLNKQIFGVVGSQTAGIPGTGQQGVYAYADLQVLIQNGIDVIANPCPGGTYWGLQAGHNSSSNEAINGDNYTRMTNYIATTVNAGMGLYVGQLINNSLFQNITGTINNFLTNLLNQGLLALNSDGSLPFQTICNATNNPQSSTSLGYVYANVQVTYQGINEKFIVSLEGGVTVVTLGSQLPQSAPPATPVL